MSVFCTWPVETTAAVFFSTACVCVYKPVRRPAHTLLPTNTCVSSSFTAVSTGSQYHCRYHSQILGVMFLILFIRFPTGKIRLCIRTGRVQSPISDRTCCVAAILILQTGPVVASHK
jgi:hypothetical protein